MGSEPIAPDSLEKVNAYQKLLRDSYCQQDESSERCLRELLSGRSTSHSVHDGTGPFVFSNTAAFLTYVNEMGRIWPTGKVYLSV